MNKINLFALKEFFSAILAQQWKSDYTSSESLVDFMEQIDQMLMLCKVGQLNFT
jgi:hypothetical protein